MPYCPRIRRCRYTRASSPSGPTPTASRGSRAAGSCPQTAPVSGSDTPPYALAQSQIRPTLRTACAHTQYPLHPTSTPGLVPPYAPRQYRVGSPLRPRSVPNSA
eukprot:2218620-Rhodomonas_salina.1